MHAACSVGHFRPPHWSHSAARCCAQVDMRVLNTGFDEGADIVEFEHWNQ